MPPAPSDSPPNPPPREQWDGLTQASSPQQIPLAVRLTIYFVALIASMFLLSAMPTELHGVSLVSSRLPFLMLLQESLLFAGAYLPAWLLSVLEHRPAGDYGLPWRNFLGTRFWQGCLMGFGEIGLLIACISAFGGYRFGTLALSSASSILEWLVFWLVFFVVVGLYEEFLFRGYLQFTLTGAIGYWPAALVLSFGFGAIHLLNSGENWVGVADVAVVGLVLALALQRTGSLWFVVGWHAAFDFGETFLFSVPNSGVLLHGHLSNATLQGPFWLTGGTVGPEGSLFSFLIMGFAALFIHWAFPRREYRAPQS